jgi:hypothetical protein
MPQPIQTYQLIHSAAKSQSQLQQMFFGLFKQPQSESATALIISKTPIPRLKFMTAETQ